MSAHTLGRLREVPIHTPRPTSAASRVCPMCSAPIADHTREQAHACAERLRKQLDTVRHITGGQLTEGGE